MGRLRHTYTLRYKCVHSLTACISTCSDETEIGSTKDTKIFTKTLRYINMLVGMASKVDRSKHNQFNSAVAKFEH